MKVLIIGSGAREHAIAKALHRSPQKPTLFCCGTTKNPGISQLTRDYWIGDITDGERILAWAQNCGIELAIIGPEAPLEKRLADQFWACHIPVIGPTASLARIETSKAFARTLMQKHSIPGSPRSEAFTDLTKACDFLQTLGENYVIKADGLMSGKGVKVSGEHLFSHEEALAFCRTILSSAQAVTIEEKLEGEEFSLMCFCDGKTLMPMPLVQDHKRAFIDDTGPNTGGMGSYSDANYSLPFLSNDEVHEAFAITQAVSVALQKECGQRYVGILYGSFMATAKGLFVIEFNARFGDPEALNVLSILQSDFLSICQGMVNGTLANTPVSYQPLATVCKYRVPEGYPDNPIKNATLDLGGLEQQEHLYLAGVDQNEQGLVATGSRTAAYVGIATTIMAAEKQAEAAMAQLKGPFYHRADIGTQPLLQKRQLHMQQLRKFSCD